MKEQIEILNNIISILEKQMKDKDITIEEKDKEIDRLRSIIGKINFISKI